MNEITEVIKSTIPGVVGATSGVVYTRGHWLKRIANIFVSSATVYYTYEYVSTMTGLPGGMVSFFLGLFAAPTMCRDCGSLDAARAVGFCDRGCDGDADS